jgi:hypothetical protein
MTRPAALEIRACRGTRKSSVYLACTLDGTTVQRIRRVAARRQLPGLAAALDTGDLPKDAARALARDTDTARASGELLDVDHELVELAGVANWCSRAPRGAWLSIRPRDRER